MNAYSTLSILKGSWLFALTFLFHAVYGQIRSGSVDTLVSASQTIVLQSKFVVPESLQIKLEDGDKLHANEYFLREDTLFFKESILLDDKDIRLKYRYLRAPLFEETRLLDSTLIAKQPTNYYNLNNNEEVENINFKSNRDLNYSGSFARGFSIGNRQDLVLNSDLDLQLSGKIGGEIDILAAISDQNIPLQPEGNTQNLREFDKVFIQLSKDQHRLLIGDYEVRSDSSHFLNFFKKWQGLKYDDSFVFDNGASLTTTGATAVSRGIYHRNIIPIQEGNQGPYRLVGANGENFIIIVAATERVYLDGVLLTRGIEKDYTIDYNNAEITFTPNLLITKDVRITVDFEYNNQRYLRTGTILKGDYKIENTRIYTSFYLEQDSRNTNSNNGVGALQKQQLALLGDNLDNAFGSSISPLTQEELTPITYRLTDSLVNNIQYDSVLVFSTASEEIDLFTAQFTFMGPNQGNYILTPGSSNGNIFEWVAPINGIPQGDHAPFVQLSAPQKTSMLSVGIDHRWSKNWSVGTEFSTSNQDLNRFSNEDNGDNRGFSSYSFIDFSSDRDSVKFNLDAGLSYEFVNKNFATINPFRNAEFSRDWNLRIGDENAQQHLAEAYFRLSRQKDFSLELQSSFLDNETGVQGFRQSASLFFRHKGFTVTSEPSFTRSISDVEKGTFFRPNFDIYQNIGKNGLKIGVRSLIEQNIRRVSPDSLSLLSLDFSRYEAYLENDVSNKLHSKVSVARRIDRLPNGNVMDLASTAHELNVKGHWNASTSQQLNWNLIARNLEVNNPDLLDEVDLQTYLGKLSYTFQLFDGVIRSTTAYELGAGQENKRSFIYLEVEPGQGVFQWVDYNEDGTQQIDEFEIAPNIDNARFIRIERPSNDFISTQNVLFNEAFQFSLKPIWFDQKGGKKFLSKFSTTSNIQISRKNNESADFDFWNPFNLDFENDGIVTAQSLIRNNLYFDRGSPKFTSYIGRSNIFSAQTLDVGGLRNRQIDNYWHYQLRFTESINHTFDFIRGNRLNEADLFENRNFNLNTTRINPALHFIFSNVFNTTIQYGWESQRNQIGDLEQLQKNEFSVSLGYQHTNTASLDFNLTYSAINFEGSTNTPVAFTLLDGLQNGENFEWQLTLNQRISKNLQLLANYNGRKTGTINVVHFGNIQIKATF